MEVKTVTLFACPISGKTFKTKKGAEACAARLLKEKEELAKQAELNKISIEQRNAQKDFVRLNLSKISDLADTIKEKAMEFWGITADLKISVGFSENVPNSHGAPIGESANWSGRDKSRPTSLPGWSGRIKGKCIIPKHLWANFRPTVNDFLFGRGGFRGFHTSSGCGGDPEGKYDIDIGFYFFLQDFPLLMAQHEQYCRALNTRRTYVEQTDELNAECEHYCNTYPSVMKLEQELYLLQNKLNMARNTARDEFLAKNTVPNPLYPENIEQLKKNFGDFPC